MQLTVHDVDVQVALLAQLLAESQQLVNLHVIVRLVHFAFEQLGNVADKRGTVGLGDFFHQLFEAHDLL